VGGAHFRTTGFTAEPKPSKLGSVAKRKAAPSSRQRADCAARLASSPRAAASAARLWRRSIAASTRRPLQRLARSSVNSAARPWAGTLSRSAAAPSCLPRCRWRPCNRRLSSAIYPPRMPSGSPRRSMRPALSSIPSSSCAVRTADCGHRMGGIGSRLRKCSCCARSPPS
jgi:hypothetical protein